MQGRSAGWPEFFDIPRLFEGRIEKLALGQILPGRRRPGKPWLNGLPRVIFHGDMGDYWAESLPGDWFATLRTRDGRIPACPSFPDEAPASHA
jgi:hypothetical protein